MPHKKKLLIDFDGTVHNYRGWKGPDVVGEPIENSRRALHILEREFQLVMFTTRPKEIVERWLQKYGFPDMRVTNVKEAAFLIVDDRAITFQGQWTQDLLKQIRTFKTHWEGDDVDAPSAPLDLPDVESPQTA